MKQFRIFILIVIFSTLSSHAFALSCVAEDVPRDFASADYVFAGKALQVRRPGKSMEGSIDAQFQSDIAVLQNFKGDLKGVATVYSNAYWGDEFTVGDTYLIFAKQLDAGITAPLCSGTRLLKYVTPEELIVLNELTGESDQKGSKQGIQKGSHGQYHRDGWGVVCTEEAKMCPDGVTYVSRQSPDCHFAKCPGER